MGDGGDGWDSDASTSSQEPRDGWYDSPNESQGRGEDDGQAEGQTKEFVSEVVWSHTPGSNCMREVEYVGKRKIEVLPNWIKLGLVKKKVSVNDGGDERVKRRTRLFYLEHAEGNENMKKNETQARDKDKLAVGNERLKKNKTIRNKDEHAMWNEKLEKNETPARDKGSNVSTKDIKTAKNEMPVRARNDYNLPPPDENTCHISNDREDCCKTMCKICEQPCALTKMRFHTIKEHNLQVWKGVSDTQ